MYKVGNKVPSAWEPNGGCHVAQTAGDFYEKGEEVPTASWAAGTIEEWKDAPDGGAALPVAAQFVRGEDGSYGFFGWTLRSVQTACAFSKTATDTTYRCRPRLTGFVETNEYLDNGCTEPLVQSTSSGCGVDSAKLAARTVGDGDACYPKTTVNEYFLIGSQFTGKFFAKATDGGCSLDTGVGVAGFHSGTRVDLAGLGEAKRAEASGAGSLEPIYGALADTSRVRLSWSDTKHATECAFGDYRAADGKTRCLPTSGGNVVTRFTDAACKTAIKLVRIAHPAYDKPDLPCQPPTSPLCLDAGTFPCDAPPKPTFGLAFAGSGCLADRRLTVYAAGAPRASFYDNSKGPCANHIVARGEAYYDATEVAPADFPEGTPAYP